MKNTATIAICHLVVLKTYVGVSEPYAPMSCLLQCRGKLSDAPINPQKHKHWPKPPTWADAKLTAAGTGRCAGGVCLGAWPQAAGVGRCLRMNGGTMGRVCFLVGGHQVGLLLRVQTPCVCCCAGCPQEQAPRSPPAHPTTVTHGHTVPCCATRSPRCHLLAGQEPQPSPLWHGGAHVHWYPVPSPLEGSQCLPGLLACWRWNRAGAGSTWQAWGHLAAAKTAPGSRRAAGLSGWAAAARLHLWRQSREAAPAPAPMVAEAGMHPGPSPDVKVGWGRRGRLCRAPGLAHGGAVRPRGLRSGLGASSQQVKRNAQIYASGRAKPLHFNYKTCVHIYSLVPRVPSTRREEPAPRGRGGGEAGRAAVAAAGLGSCSRGGDVHRPLRWGLRGRDLAGRDGGSLCLASRRVLVAQRVLAAAEGCDHAVTELEERESRGEAGRCHTAPVAGLPLSPAELLGSPQHCSAGGGGVSFTAAQGRMRPQLFYRPSAQVISDGMGLHL